MSYCREHKCDNISSGDIRSYGKSRGVKPISNHNKILHTGFTDVMIGPRENMVTMHKNDDHYGNCKTQLDRNIA